MPRNQEKSFCCGAGGPGCGWRRSSASGSTSPAPRRPWPPGRHDRGRLPVLPGHALRRADQQAGGREARAEVQVLDVAQLCSRRQAHPTPDRAPSPPAPPTPSATSWPPPTRVRRPGPRLPRVRRPAPTYPSATSWPPPTPSATSWPPPGRECDVLARLARVRRLGSSGQTRPGPIGKFVAPTNVAARQAASATSWPCQAGETRAG